MYTKKSRIAIVSAGALFNFRFSPTFQCIASPVAYAAEPPKTGIAIKSRSDNTEGKN